MTSKATQPFHFQNPDTLETLFFDVGEKVPDEIAARVSAHVVDHVPVLAGVSTPSGGASIDDVEAKARELVYQSGNYVPVGDVEQRIADAVQAQKDREAAALTALLDQETEFDPSADGVNADAVKGYLEALDRDTAAGAYEFGRVVDAEQQGKNRSTAIPS